MSTPGYTEGLDEAMGILGRARNAEREHVAEVALQIVVANNLGEVEVVNALARVLRNEAQGGWQDDYPALWKTLHG